MKIFKKQGKETPQNAIPGVFTLLTQTRAIASPERTLLAGYAAWTIFPALATFLLSTFPLPSLLEALATNCVLLGYILLSIWANACLALVGIRSLQKEPLEEREISTQARKALPTLLFVFAFSLFFTVFGLYLLIIPGISAYVSFAFASTVVLQKPGTSFSQAIATSRKLSVGRFFSVLWRLVAGNGIFGILYFVLCLFVLGGIFLAVGINPSDLLQTTLTTGNNLPAWIPLSLSVLSLPFMPYSALYTVVLYDALKTR